MEEKEKEDEGEGELGKGRQRELGGQGRNKQTTSRQVYILFSAMTNDKLPRGGKREGEDWEGWSYGLGEGKNIGGDVKKLSASQIVKRKF